MRKCEFESGLHAIWLGGCLEIFHWATFESAQNVQSCALSILPPLLMHVCEGSYLEYYLEFRSAEYKKYTVYRRDWRPEHSLLVPQSLVHMLFSRQVEFKLMSDLVHHNGFFLLH